MGANDVYHNCIYVYNDMRKARISGQMNVCCNLFQKHMALNKPAPLWRAFCTCVMTDSVSSSRMWLMELELSCSRLSSGSEVLCTESTYKCKNNKCITKVNPECDGTRDCDDGSDEENCSKSQTKHVSEWKLVIVFACIAELVWPDGFEQAVLSLTGCFTLQTAGGVFSRRRVSWAARTQRRESFHGRSASTSRNLATCAEHPSSARNGWSLLHTVCKTTEKPGKVQPRHHRRPVLWRIKHQFVQFRRYNFICPYSFLFWGDKNNTIKLDNVYNIYHKLLLN